MLSPTKTEASFNLLQEFLKCLQFPTIYAFEMNRYPTPKFVSKLEILH